MLSAPEEVSTILPLIRVSLLAWNLLRVASSVSRPVEKELGKIERGQRLVANQFSAGPPVENECNYADFVL